MKYLLIFDSISSGTRTCLYTADGNLVAQFLAPLPLSLSGYQAQQNAQDWWNSLVYGARQVSREIDVTQIAAISFTAQCMCCLCVDDSGTPLYPALIWSDTRAQELGPSVLQHSATSYPFTGTADHYGSCIQKLNWFRNKQPQVYQNTFKMLQCKDYLAYRLTGRMCTDFSDACCSCAFDTRQQEWSLPVLHQLGLDPSKLPTALPSTAVIGSVSGQAAQETGLSVGTPVVIGGQDFVCSALGAGCVQSGDVYLSLGSSSWIAACSEQMIVDDIHSMSNQIFPVSNTYLSMANLQGVGTVFKWLRNRILRYATPETPCVDPYRNIYPYTGLAERIVQSPPGANGLLFLPYLLEHAPNHPDPWTSAAYIGLNWHHTQEDLLRAAAEGVVFDIKTYLDLIVRQTGKSPAEITVVGTASHEAELLQLISDILDVPIKNLSLRGTTDPIGAAILAGYGVGIYDNFAQASRFWSEEQHFQPNPARSAYYRQLYSVFQDACTQLSSVQKELFLLNSCAPAQTLARGD